MPGEPPEVVWAPDPALAAASRLGAFLRRCREVAGTCLDGYDDLLAWSLADLDRFWTVLAEEAGVRWHHRPACSMVPGPMPGGVRWFPGGTLSYGEHALRAAGERPDDVAVVGVSQTRPDVTWTWSELAGEVRRARSGLRRLGVGPGHRVAGYLPNVPEAVAALLATASLGATWVSCPPELGPGAVLDRFGQVEPTVLVAVDGYRYGRKAVDRRAEVAAVRAGLPGLRAVVHLPYLSGEPLPGSVAWDELGGTSPEPLAFEPVGAGHPLYVLFSSGTTGLPKPIVHGTAGVMLEHWKALALHHDLGPGDRFFWFTTTGWMMWNYLVSGLVTGSSIVLFDGDPGHPDLGTVWRVAGEAGATVLGVGAPLLVASEKAGLQPARLADLSSVRQVGATGAPLPAHAYRWLARELPGRQVNAVSGGTDVCTAFVGMNPLVPVWAGEMSRPLLGCDVVALRPDGTEASPGEQGELVVRSPMPSMPVGLWGDHDGSRLRAAYFERFPGLWRQGDWVTFTERGSCVISGRSDATLNRGGVRLGTAELYAVVESMPEVADSLVVHLEAGDELVLFLVPARPGLDEAVRARVAATLRSRLSPRHVPDRIVEVPAVPRTLTGKKMEVPVKRILQGEPPEAVVAGGALANPDSLLPYVAMAPGPPAGAGGAITPVSAPRAVRRGRG
ncbi:MAG: acetoacetate--CoA ligase [Acidimicrobiales bacterium]